MRILYLSPHQDDEVLTMGASIRADVAAGHDVWVYLVCRGDKSSARTSPTLVNRLGYTPTVEAFCAARDREFAASVPNLGASMMMLSQAQREPEQETVPARIADTVEGAFTQGFDLICAHTLTDPHVDHANTGRAAQILVARGFAPVWRAHVSFYNKGYHVPPPALSVRGESHPITLAQQEPYRRVDVPNGFWGVGYISVSSLFVGQLTDPASYYFLPVPPVPVARVLRTGMGEPVRSSDGTVLTFRLATPPATYDASVYQ